MIILIVILCMHSLPFKHFFLISRCMIRVSSHIGAIIIHYPLFSVFLFTTFCTCTSPSIFSCHFSFSSITSETPSPPGAIWCAIIHVRRAILSLNGIIIGPALLLIAQVTIPSWCIWANACGSFCVWHLCGCLDEPRQMCPLEQNCRSMQRLRH